MSMPMTAIPELRCDMACSLSSVPQASFLRWRGWSTAGPSHYRTLAGSKSRSAASPCRMLDNPLCCHRQLARPRNSMEVDDAVEIQGILQQTAPVGSFKPNAFGLYDMH